MYVLGGLLEEGRLVLARAAPRRPEVDDDCLALELGERELLPGTGSIKSLEREVGRCDLVASGKSVGGSALVIHDDLPDEEAEQRGDACKGDHLCDPLQPARARGAAIDWLGHAGTMKTGVPTSTCSKSHSTCGISMRMHPWDAE